jgi:malonyl-CoA O-methyltransferase
VDGVLADLKATGARNALAERARGLSTPRKWRRMRAAYETFRQQGRLPATYEVVFGHAWAPRSTARGRRPDDTVSLDEFKRQLKKNRA